MTNLSWKQHGHILTMAFWEIPRLERDKAAGLKQPKMCSLKVDILIFMDIQYVLLSYQTVEPIVVYCYCITVYCYVMLC